MFIDNASDIPVLRLVTLPPLTCSSSTEGARPVMRSLNGSNEYSDGKEYSDGGHANQQIQ
jgi:hypothetical protein